MKKSFSKRVIYKDYAYEIFNIFRNIKDMNTILIRLFYRLSDIYDCLSEHEISMHIANEVLSNIYVMNEYLLEQARMLSGIAYSINNYFDDMEDLKNAEKLLNRANRIVTNINIEKEDILLYVQTQGRILSNYGSNCISKGKYNQRMDDIYFMKAVEWHTKALKFRQNQLNSVIDNEEYMNIINGEIATSYTNIATSNFYLKKYEEAISYHLKAYEIRDELNMEKAKTINMQRIVGCTIEMYRRDLQINIKFLKRGLEYYPELLKNNYRFNDYKSLEINIEYYFELFKIIINDKRVSELISEIGSRNLEPSD